MKYYSLTGNGQGSKKSGDTIEVAGLIGTGISVHDFLNGSQNKCGVFSIKLWADSLLIYETDMSRLNFSEARYILSHIDYRARKTLQTDIQKSFIAPNNKARIYKEHGTDGFVSVLPGEVKNMRYQLTDAYGNRTDFRFFLKGTDPADATPCESIAGFVQFMPFNLDNSFSTELIRLFFPENVFFEDIWFQYNLGTTLSGLFSPLHHLHDEMIPVFDFYTIDIQCDNLPEKLYTKALIVKVDTSGTTPRYQAMGGTYQNGFISASIREFGAFAIAADTIAPVIKAVNIIQNEDMSGKSSIRFTMEDELSGISSYEGRIDGQWAMFRYDAKSDLIWYEFSDQKISAGEWHALVLTVIDKKGNKTEKSYRFKW
jgi:hypothetical protein